MLSQLSRHALLVVALVACKDKAADAPKPSDPAPTATAPVAPVAKPELPAEPVKPVEPKPTEVKADDKAGSAARVHTVESERGQPLTKDELLQQKKGLGMLKTRQPAPATPAKPE